MLPIGLAYIVAAVKDLVEVEVIDPIAERVDCNNPTPYKRNTSILGLTPPEIVDAVKSKPDVCLISSMFSAEWPVTRDLINLLKKKYPETIIIGGGEHFTALPEYSLQNSELDVCVLGEGELTIRELIEEIQRTNKIPTHLEGTVVKMAGGSVRNPARKRIKNLEEIKLPAWEYFNVNRFLDVGVSNTANGIKGVRGMPLTATRGCPYQCTFCSNPTMWGNLWRARPVADVAAEMELWVRTYQATHFDFADLTAVVRKDWIVDFCNLMIEKKLNVTWGMPSGTRSEALDYEVLTLLQKSGCTDIDYAPENGSDYILKIMRKQINKDKMIESMKQCYKIGINAKANIIFGYPEEKRRHVLETFIYIFRIAKAGMNDLLVSSVSVYPGSHLYETFLKEGRIKLDEDYFLDLTSQGSLDVSECYSNFYSKHELYFFKVFGFAYFYMFSLILHPKRIWVLFKDIVIRRKGSTRLSMGIINIFTRTKNRFLNYGTAS